MIVASQAHVNLKRTGMSKAKEIYLQMLLDQDSNYTRKVEPPITVRVIVRVPLGFNQVRSRAVQRLSRRSANG